MGYSYKTYTDEREFRKKFATAKEGEIVYGISRTHIMVLAQDAGAVYKVGNTALINMEIFEQYLEQFREPRTILPQHIYNKLVK